MGQTEDLVQRREMLRSSHLRAAKNVRPFRRSQVTVMNGCRSGSIIEFINHQLRVYRGCFVCVVDVAAPIFASRRPSIDGSPRYARLAAAQLPSLPPKIQTNEGG